MEQLRFLRIPAGLHAGRVSIRRTLRALGFLMLVGLITPGCDSLSTPGSGEGSIAMFMTDAPADVEAVFVAVSSVDVHTSGSGEAEGWVTVSDGPAMYDLLALRNGSAELIASTRLRAGHYTQIRLILGAGSYLMVNGLPVSLEVASGFETGVKLNHQFTIEEDRTYAITLDFDAERSLVPSGLSFRLKPVISIFVNETSGSVSGTVLPAAARARVTVLAGTDTVTTTVCEDSSGYFKFPAIQEGTYSLGISATTPGLYQDTVLTNVNVVRHEETSVGTVSLNESVGQ